VTTPTKGGTYEAAPCDALGKGVAACGSTLRIWMAPEGFPDRPGWWHARCVRCDAPFLWRPDPWCGCGRNADPGEERCPECRGRVRRPAATTEPHDSGRQSETWTVTITGADLDALDTIATLRNRRHPDAFGVLGHRPNVVRDAVSAGLRELASAPRLGTVPPMGTPAWAYWRATTVLQGVRTLADILLTAPYLLERVRTLARTSITKGRRCPNRVERGLLTLAALEMVGYGSALRTVRLRDLTDANDAAMLAVANEAIKLGAHADPADALADWILAIEADLLPKGIKP
jgi:hypothetical protein